MTETREGTQHREARRLVEFYLESKGIPVTDKNYFKYNDQFVEDNKLQKRFKGHSYDIVTNWHIIEIDDLDSHPKPSHQINDGIAAKYITESERLSSRYDFYRLLKEEIADRKGRILDPKDVADYLRENLF